MRDVEQQQQQQIRIHSQNKEWVRVHFEWQYSLLIAKVEILLFRLFYFFLSTTKLFTLPLVSKMVKCDNGTRQPRNSVHQCAFVYIYTEIDLYIIMSSEWTSFDSLQFNWIFDPFVLCIQILLAWYCDKNKNDNFFKIYRLN